MAVFTLFLFLVALFVVLAWFCVGYALVSPRDSKEDFVPVAITGFLATVLVLYAFYSLAYYLNEWINWLLGPW